MRDAIGAFYFEAQYQQSPRTPDGNLFKRKYFKLVEQNPPFRSEGEFFISIDSALSTSSTADYTAISIVYIDQGLLYVIKAEGGRWEYERLKERTLAWIKRFARPQRPVNVLVEYAGSGIALAQFLHEVRDPRYRAWNWQPRREKETRAALVLPWIEAGIFIVNIPGQNDWVEPFLSEFMTFPKGANDDQVDSLVQLLHMNRARSLLRTPEIHDAVEV